MEDGITYYEANLKAAYYLIRSGKILDLVEETLGEYAATVMSTVMFLGHAQVSQLETIPELQANNNNDSGNHVETNGTDGDHEEEEEEKQQNGVDDSEENNNYTVTGLLHPTLKALAAHGYINRVRECHFWSSNDNFMEAEKTARLRLDTKLAKGKKGEETIRVTMEDLLKERLDGDISHGLMYNGVPRGAKRRKDIDLEAEGVPNKRKHEEDTMFEDEFAAEEEVEDDEWQDDGDTIPMDVSITIHERKDNANINNDSHSPD